MKLAVFPFGHETAAPTAMSSFSSVGPNQDEAPTSCVARPNAATEAGRVVEVRGGEERVVSGCRVGCGALTFRFWSCRCCGGSEHAPVAVTIGPSQEA